MDAARPRVILWDIDGTLVKTSGAGMRALRHVARHSAPMTALLQDLRLDGMTDRKIGRAMLAAERHAADPGTPHPVHAAGVTVQEMEPLFTAYLVRLEENLRDPAGYQVLPGVPEILDAVDRLGPCVHALGTGNLREGARIKLTPAGLWSRFSFGGFGSDAEERADILRAAWDRAADALGHRPGEEDFVVVGDTPADVAAARALGLACVGVATGRFLVGDLLSAGADDALPSLAEHDAPRRIARARRALVPGQPVG
jgi:phosphoglycolate phosphatase-like HAD superfamily hydrolase